MVDLSLSPVKTPTRSLPNLKVQVETNLALARFCPTTCEIRRANSARKSEGSEHA